MYGIYVDVHGLKLIVGSVEKQYGVGEYFLCSQAVKACLAVISWTLSSGSLPLMQGRDVVGSHEGYNSAMLLLQLKMHTFQ